MEPPDTLALEMDGGYNRQQLRAFLTAISADLLRVKGFFRDRQGCAHVEDEGPQIHFEDGPGDEVMAPAKTSLVLIGRQKGLAETVRLAWQRHVAREIRISDE